jgi:hypothetical protein
MRLRTGLGAVGGLSVVAAAILVVACGSADSGFGDGEGQQTGTEGGPATDPGQFGDNVPHNAPGDAGPGTGDASCASASAQAVLTKRPVDIIVAVDNSGSMSEEISAIQSQINQNLATIIGASGLDYRVILLSRHGAVGAQSICISSPLSDGGCSPVPARPAETGRFFHYNVEVDSHNAWCKIFDGFARADNTDGYTLHPTGYGSLLRKGAFKTIVVISDDNVACTDTSVLRPDGGVTSVTFNDLETVAGGITAGAAFDTNLLAFAPEQFGDGDRNYVHHAIVGVAGLQHAATGDAGFVPDAGGVNDPNLHPVSAPLTTRQCSPGAESESAGTGYQHLSALTGGLRYPSCTHDYTAVFKAIAKGVIESSAVSCDFPVPQPTAGQTLDLATLAVQYKPGGGGAVQEFGLVPSLAACAPGKFWIEGGATGTVHLCPATCATVKADLQAKVSVVSGCARLSEGGSGPK